MANDKKIIEDLDEVQSLYHAKKTELALKKIDKIISRSEKHYLPYNYRGIIYLASNQPALALADFKKTITLNIGFAEGFINLGSAYLALKDYTKSLQAYLHALKLDEYNLQLQLNIGILYDQMGEYKLAITTFKKVLEINSNIEYAHHLIADTYAKESKNDLSLFHHEKAQHLNPSNYINYFLIGRDYLWSGKKELASQHFQKCLEINPNHAASYFALSKLGKIKVGEGGEENIKSLINNSSDILGKTYLNFALAKFFDDQKDYEKSFECLKIGNDLMKSYNQFNFIQYKKNIFQSISFFNSKISRLTLSEKNSDSNINPIFILGMPRSGTTLLEQVISNNSSVFGAGELDTIHEALNKIISEKNLDSKGIENSLYKLRKNYLDRIKNITDKMYVVDKLPLNFFWVGYIKKIFPNAKIIHIKRSPIATCFSIYKNLFTEGSLEFAYDQDDIIEFYRLYMEFMDYWHSLNPDTYLEIDYDRFIVNAEVESKRIFNHIGLEYTSNMVNIEDNKRSVMTASDLQIRSGIYTGSSDDWMNYKIFLKKFINAFTT
jgi:tetratricopeptide (TPR) repeat protein